ncbi:MAG: VCBS repeat-containing protein [Isosphaeraceae bacterium]
MLHNHGDGSYDPAVSYAAFSAPVYLASGDFNEDGYDDFCVANSYAASSMSVVMNNGDGTYAPPKTYNIGQTGYEIEAGDFNGDGHDDYAVRGGSSYMIHLGKGDGSFYPEVSYSVPSGRFESGGKGDVNGDGAVDFVYPSTSGVTVVTNANDDRSNVAGRSGSW